MTFDQYSRCGYECLYCFAAYQKSVSSGSFLAGKVRHVNVEALKRVFTDPDATKRAKQFKPFVTQRKTLQWGGLADPFCPVERKNGIGLELLRFFQSIDYPITFSTKATWWTKDSRYTELFKAQKNWNVKISVITLDEDKRHIMERRCPSSRNRLEAMARIASWNSGGVTLRLRPFIIGVSDPRHQELIHQAAEHGATAVSTEFWCVENRSPWLKQSLPLINKTLGYDVMAFYKKYSYLQGYMRLNRNIKRPFVDEMEHACKDNGLRFYVSDAHFKERSHNGCCCGLPPTWNYHRGQWAEALMIAKLSGLVFWKDMAKHLDFAKEFIFRDASGFNTGCEEKRARFHKKSMFDYLRHIWNHPDNGQSPYKMFEGILKPVSTDPDGNVVYVFNKTRA
jgi:DNA repair photolyase